MLILEPDYMAAVYDFIVEFTGIDGGVVFRGNQSHAALPDDDEFCIFTPITRTRLGSNIRSFTAEGVPDDTNGTETERQGVIINMQIDFYGDNAARYAQAIDTAAHSLMANKFFRRNDYAVRCLNSESPRDLTAVDETNTYSTRWSVAVNLVIESGISQSEPWFEDVTLDALKNADVYFPV